MIECTNKKRSYKKGQFGKYALFSPKNLINYEKNSRTHSDEQINELVNSINEFGFTNPILIDEDNIIIAGHARLKAAIIIEMDEVPCITLSGLTKEQKSALVIADNKLALNSGWDNETLLSELSFLKESDFDLSFTGFSEDELNDLFPSKIEAFCDEDEIPESPEEPITKLGDIWILGKNRLMCGDGTSITELDKLLKTEKIDMLFTDPPYGINEQTDRSFSSRTRKCKGNTFDKIIGDDSTETAKASYSVVCTQNIPIQVWWGANYYCNLLPETGNWLVWDKRVDDKQRDMNSDCELAWIKSKARSVRIFRHLWKGMIKGSENGEARCHPTQKPVALAEWCFNEYGKESKNILDLFGGSGSTIIACEKTNRRCFMMELSPKYCDVIISRWEKFTGKKAILEDCNEG